MLKPGAHGLVWAMPRTQHWTMCGLEDAGFVIRDVIAHINGQGWPKGSNASIAIDRKMGAERESGTSKAYAGRGGRPGWCRKRRPKPTASSAIPSATCA